MYDCTKKTKIVKSQKDCFESGYSYRPVNMRTVVGRYHNTGGPRNGPHPGIRGLPDAESCQHKCEYTKGCAHFSYWPRDKGCHLQDKNAKKTKNQNAIAGP